MSTFDYFQHWECRMFMTIVNYIMAANYAWIFVEALYLQMLISVAVFTEKKHLHIYMLLGWSKYCNTRIQTNL